MTTRYIIQAILFGVASLELGASAFGVQAATVPGWITLVWACAFAAYNWWLSRPRHPLD